MTVNFRILVFWATFVICISKNSAFFLGWGSSETTVPPPVQWQGPTFRYHSSYIPPTSNDASQIPVPVAVPAIPVQVPLRAQLAPAHNVHNVQLVPCLCPVSQDDIDKSPENVYSIKNTLPAK